MNKIQTLANILIPAILLIAAQSVGLLLNDGYFETTMLPFDLEDQTISYPVLPDTIDGVVLVVIVTVVSVGLMFLWLHVTFTNTQKRRNPYVYMTIYLVFSGAVLVFLLTNIIKNYRGGLRPHFLEACEINQTLAEIIRSTTQKTWVNLENSKVICLAKGKVDYRWSFPSGHSSSAFFGGILSVLILQYIKLPHCYNKEWNPLWLTLKTYIEFSFITFSCWVAVSRIVDYHHHWWDVLAGSLLGTVFAVGLFYWFLLPTMQHIESQQQNQAQLPGLWKPINGYGSVQHPYILQ